MKIKENTRHTRIFENNQEDLLTLREWLAHRNLTQASMARLMNVRREQVNKWCAGTHKPSGQNLINLCEVLDCKPHEIAWQERKSTPTTSAESSSFSQRVLSFVTTLATELGV